MRTKNNQPQANSETPYLDAQVLLAHVLGKSRAWVLAHPEAVLDSEQEKRLEDGMARLAGGEPLPYILGHWEFFGLDFMVTPDVLIPRPETEMLVEHALAWLSHHPQAHQAADVGTGSGCIAISLASRNPTLHISASDISAAALEVARANAHKHNVDSRLDFVQADLLSKSDDLYDIITANLPYIPTGVLHDLAVFGKEPSIALDGGGDGLNLIRRLFSQAGRHLTPKSLLLVEIEATQGKAVIEMAAQTFPRAEIRLFTDLAGKDRLVEINYQIE